MPDERPADRDPERPEPGRANEPLHELTLGRPRTPTDPPKPRRETQPTSDDEGMEALAAHCRAKAEAARWAAEHQRRLRERDEHPDEDAPTGPAMRQWAERL